MHDEAAKTNAYVRITIYGHDQTVCDIGNQLVEVFHSAQWSVSSGSCNPTLSTDSRIRIFALDPNTFSVTAVANVLSAGNLKLNVYRTCVGGENPSPVIIQIGEVR
jgi:hypothetical protein